MANFFERLHGENDFRQHVIRRSSNTYKTTDFSSLLNIILHFLIILRLPFDRIFMLRSHQTQNRSAKLKQNKTKQEQKQKQETGRNSNKS